MEAKVVVAKEEVVRVAEGMVVVAKEVAAKAAVE